MITTIIKREEKSAKRGTSRDAISRLFLDLSRLSFQGFTGVFFRGQRRANLPTTKRKGREGSQFPPPEGRANFHREGPTPIPRRANPHPKKEWGTLRARRKGKKEGPKPTPKRQDQFPPEEGQANPNPEKEGPTSHPPREGRAEHQL